MPENKVKKYFTLVEAWAWCTICQDMINLSVDKKEIINGLQTGIYTKEWKHANPHPNAMILLDDGVYIRHFLEETDADKLEVGMRVEAVWKEDHERGEGAADVRYFRTIEK